MALMVSLCSFNQWLGVLKNVFYDTYQKSHFDNIPSSRLGQATYARCTSSAKAVLLDGQLLADWHCWRSYKVPSYLRRTEHGATKPRTLGHGFNQSLKHVFLPSDLENLTLGDAPWRKLLAKLTVRLRSVRRCNESYSVKVLAYYGFQSFSVDGFRFKLVSGFAVTAYTGEICPVHGRWTATPKTSPACLGRQKNHHPLIIISLVVNRTLNKTAIL